MKCQIPIRPEINFILKAGTKQSNLIFIKVMTGMCNAHTVRNRSRFLCYGLSCTKHNSQLRESKSTWS